MIRFFQRVENTFEDYYFLLSISGKSFFMLLFFIYPGEYWSFSFLRMEIGDDLYHFLYLSKGIHSFRVNLFSVDRR
jgi:hypothetical protein